MLENKGGGGVKDYDRSLTSDAGVGGKEKGGAGGGGIFCSLSRSVFFSERQCAVHGKGVPSIACRHYACRGKGGCLSLIVSCAMSGRVGVLTCLFGERDGVHGDGVPYGQAFTGVGGRGERESILCFGRGERYTIQSF